MRNIWGCNILLILKDAICVVVDIVRKAHKFWDAFKQLCIVAEAVDLWTSP